MKLKENGTSIESLSGVGSAKAKLFARLNIFTIADLLQAFPRDYEDRTKRIPLSKWNECSKVHTIAKVLSHSYFGYGRMKTLKIIIEDETRTAELIAFNRSFLEKTLPVGSIISVTGSFQIKYNSLQSTSFEAAKICDEGNIEDFKNYTLSDSKIFPVYPLTEGLTQTQYRKIIAGALKLYAPSIDDELPEELIKKHSLLHKKTAIQFIHNPENLENINAAKKTLAYEELFHFEYKLAQRLLVHRGFIPSPEELACSAQNKSNEAKEILSDEEFIKQLSPRQKILLESLMFALTADQKKVIYELNEEIDRSQKDLLEIETLNRQPFSMSRLIQGDVGSGKTLVAFFSILRTIDYKKQCDVLAPTEILARQHAQNAAALLEKCDVRIAFLTGNLKASGRENLLNALKSGNVDVVIGTHALFSTNTNYKNLSLVIIDEQHRFGVNQRESLINKGRITAGGFTHSPDVMMMSATPIPQSIAQSVFGDLDVSTIKTMPEGRKPVETHLSVMGNEENVYRAVLSELQKGHQAYFVYPRIDENAENTGEEDSGDKNKIKNVLQMFDYLSKVKYPDYKCGLIHGKLTDEEQSQILEDFKNGKIQILIATTVVEVGVDVANATCMVIEHADRFGLAELHQLRGRVGRSSLQSYCYLIYGKNLTETGKERMKAMHSSTDGFYIAEEDLKLRGPGEVFGTLQSGYLQFKVADLTRDKEIFIQARNDAFNYAKN